MKDDRIASYREELMKVDNTVQIVAVVLPSNRKDKYDVIKTICCVELGGEMV